jgi:SAM-dependent methyltransferase
MSRLENLAIWNTYYSGLKSSLLFPNEYVVRTFFASYPGLKMVKDYGGKSVCDIGCGDGRNMSALVKTGMKLFGTEISDEICQITKEKLAASSGNITADIRAGTNESVPFDDASFDYLLSWNACYYMDSPEADFAAHVAEFARITKPGGYLVCCVPAPTCFSLQGAEHINDNTIRLNPENPKWGILAGSIYRTFDGAADIEDAFGSHFENFSHCTLKDDCFGLQLDYFVFVCQRC